MVEGIWVFGLVLNIIGSILVSLGMNYLKLSVRAPEADDESMSKEVQAHFKCIGGMFFVVGSVINFVSFGYAPQSLLASLGGIQFLCSLVFGYYILNEIVTYLHVIAAFILSAGVCLAVIFSSHQEKLYASAHDILLLYDASYMTFIGVVVSFLICAELLYHVMNMIDNDELEVFCCHQVGGDNHQHAPVPLTSTTSTLEAELESTIQQPSSPSSPSASVSAETAVDAEEQHGTAIEALGGTNSAHVFEKACLYSIVSATIGTQSVLQAKCIAELIKTSIVNNMDFSILFVPELAIFVFVFLACLAIWIYRLMTALTLFDGLIIIPLLQVCWTLSAILQGGVFFQEFQHFSDRQFFHFCIGVFIMIFGVMLLAYASNQSGSILHPHFEFTLTPTKLTINKTSGNKSAFHQMVVREKEQSVKRKGLLQYSEKEEGGEQEDIEGGIKSPIPCHLQKGKRISIDLFTRMNQSEEDWVYNPRGLATDDPASSSNSANPFGPSSPSNSPISSSTESEGTMPFFHKLLSYRS